MTKKWWRVVAAVEADTPSAAVNTLRRVGTMPETVEDITGDLGRIQFEVPPTQIPSPWRPAETAPKDGTEFIGYDANIGHAETMFWDEHISGFANLDHKPINFTQWIEKPTQKKPPE